MNKNATAQEVRVKHGDNGLPIVAECFGSLKLLKCSFNFVFQDNVFPFIKIVSKTKKTASLTGSGHCYQVSTVSTSKEIVTLYRLDNCLDPVNSLYMYVTLSPNHKSGKK